jgi:hypothetical protein
MLSGRVDLAIRESDTLSLVERTLRLRRLVAGRELLTKGALLPRCCTGFMARCIVRDMLQDIRRD